MVKNIGRFENIHYDKMYFIMRQIMREKLWLQQSTDDERPKNRQDHQNDGNLSSQVTDIQKPACTSLSYDNLQNSQLPTSKSGVETRENCLQVRIGIKLYLVKLNST